MVRGAAIRVAFSLILQHSPCGPRASKALLHTSAHQAAQLATDPPEAPARSPPRKYAPVLEVVVARDRALEEGGVVPREEPGTVEGRERRVLRGVNLQVPLARQQPAQLAVEPLLEPRELGAAARQEHVARQLPLQTLRRQPDAAKRHLRNAALLQVEVLGTEENLGYGEPLREEADGLTAGLLVLLGRLLRRRRRGLTVRPDCPIRARRVLDGLPLNGRQPDRLPLRRR
ncbi:histidine kinase [Babesia caballi]|uniref:Histidine kinase n=1 Tax=Babesia caballi TaxID=5871 RepID=A0AAV4M2J0_BABCB|nr:histidine kinase [Babesia caballi]